MASSSTPEKKNNQKFGKWKIRLPHRRRCWKICRSWSQQKHSKKDAQWRSIDEVVFAKWKRNKTTPRHTAARIRRLPQQISIVCEKSLVMNMSQQHSEELSLLWSVILETYATASLLSKDNVWQLNCSRGTCLNEFLNFDTRLWISFCVGFDN